MRYIKMYCIGTDMSVIGDKNSEPKINQPIQRTKVIFFFFSNSKTLLDVVRKGGVGRYC